jgi:hypothetical protein
LLRTRFHASLWFSRSHTSSIHRWFPAGLSVPLSALGVSVPLVSSGGASLPVVNSKASCSWFFCRFPSMRFEPIATPIVQAFAPFAGATMPSADFCPAIWSPLGFLSRVAATQSRPPGVSPSAFHAQSPDLHFPCLMNMDFAEQGSLVPRWCLISGSCSSTRAFAPRFFRTPPRDDALALR